MNFIFNLVFPLTILLTLNIKIYRELRTLRYPYAINGLPMTVDAIEDSPGAAPFIRKPRAPKINSITYNSRPSCLTIDDAEERDRNTRYVRGYFLRNTWTDKRGHEWPKILCIFRFTKASILMVLAYGLCHTPRLITNTMEMVMDVQTSNVPWVSTLKFICIS